MECHKSLWARSGIPGSTFNVYLVIAALLISWAALPIDAREVRVATFNIENGTGDIGGEKYEAIKAILARIDADVIGFQELRTTTFGNWQLMADELGYPHAVMGGNGPLSGHLYNGYFSRYPIIDTHNVASPPDATELSRFPFRIVVDVPDAQRPLVLWNMHHKASNGNGDRFRRAIEAIRIMQDMATYLNDNPDHVEYVLLGDMNDDDRDNQSPDFYFSIPTVSFPGAYQLGADITFPVAYATFPTDKYLLGGAGLYKVNAYWQGTDIPITRPSSGRQLDYIFTSPSLLFSPLGAPQGEIYHSPWDDDDIQGLPKAGSPLPFSTTFDASDHLAVFADIHMADFSPVLPSEPFTPIGNPGGPFAPADTIFTVTNTNAFDVFWSVSTDVPWLSISPTSLTVATLDSEDVTVTVNSQADLLPPGDHIGAVLFSNTVSGLTVVREIHLSILDHLTVSPDAGLLAEGFSGGPFTPSATAYTVSNKTAATVGWTASASANWITITPSSWTLLGQQAVDVQASINANADALPPGTYHATVTLENTLSGRTHERTMTLIVNGRLCEAVDRCDLTWTTGGAAPWFYQTNITVDSVDAAQSGSVDPNQQSWMQTTVTGPATLSFDWRVSSRTNEHHLTFSIDETPIHSLSGEQDWHTFTHNLASGVHTVRWTYAVNAFAPAGEDAAWVDRVRLDALMISPTDTMLFAGPSGGPFLPAPQIYSLTNTASETIPWAADIDAPWLEASPSTGLLLPGQTVDVEIIVTPAALAFDAGVYPNRVVFSNALTGTIQERPVTLDVQGELCIALDNCALTWTTGGPEPWLHQTEVTSDGVDAAQSGALTNVSDISWIETTVTGPARLHFQWNLSRGANFNDYMVVRRDGFSQEWLFNDSGWQEESIQLASGTHTLRWEYVKQTSGTAEPGRGWIDQVQLDHLIVSPSDMLTTSGLLGGPFTPDAWTYTLTNAGSANIPWTAATATAWLNVSPQAGLLAPGETVTVAVELTGEADSLEQGNHLGSVAFVHEESGITSDRTIRVTVLDDLLVQPTSFIWFRGPPGGPYAAQPSHFALSNAGMTEIEWTVSGEPDWLSLSAHDGSLAAGETNRVGATLTESAFKLSGFNSALLTFSNASSERTLTRWVYLSTSGSPVISPVDTWHVEGLEGGPFTPSNRTFTLTNPSAAPQTWSVSSPTSWLTVDTAAVPLDGFSSGDVTIELAPSAGDLPIGTYEGSLLFSNNATGGMAYRSVNLSVGVLLCDALDACELTWHTGGAASWLYQTATTFDGVDAAVSGSITHNQDVWMETTVTGPGTLSFHWKVDSENNWDYHEFWINGILQPGRISGNVDWQQQIHTIETGEQTLRWRYAKDSIVSVGADRGWVDRVVWVPDHTAMGIPTAWYQQFDLAPANGEGWDALDHQDATGNGLLNWTHYAPGLDPTDANASFEILRVDHGPNRVPLIEWFGGLYGPDTPYLIQTTTNPATGMWTTIGTHPRSAGTNTWTGSEPLNGTRLYRIVAEPD